MGDRPVAKASTYTGQHNTEKRGPTIMTRAGLEPTIPVFERSNTLRALDCAATGTGARIRMTQIYWNNR
jgi:hypothetical protein